MDKLFIVMPAYNEEENIVSVIKEWYVILEHTSMDSRLVVADGGSTDNTLKILSELQSEYPKLEVFSKPGTDHGTKLIFLYKYAIQQNADYIFQTDSDGQTLPDEFEQFWRLRNQYDAVIGKRFKRQDGRARAFVENVLRFILWIFFQVQVPDANAPFRLMQTELVNKYITKLPEDYNLPNAMLVTYFARFHEKVKYLNVTFRPRRNGTNYMNVRRIIKIGWQSLWNFYRLRRDL